MNLSFRDEQLVLKRHGLVSIFLVAVVLELRQIGLADACAAVGLLYLVFGLWRIVGRLGFCKSIGRGRGGPTRPQAAGAVTADRQTARPYAGYLLIAAILISCSLIALGGCRPKVNLSLSATRGVSSSRERQTQVSWTTPAAPRPPQTAARAPK